jgi:hypothetical protein
MKLFLLLLLRVFSWGMVMEVRPLDLWRGMFLRES